MFCATPLRVTTSVFGSARKPVRLRILYFLYSFRRYRFSSGVAAKVSIQFDSQGQKNKSNTFRWTPSRPIRYSALQLFLAVRQVARYEKSPLNCKCTKRRTAFTRGNKNLNFATLRANTSRTIPGNLEHQTLHSLMTNGALCVIRNQQSISTWLMWHVFGDLFHPRIVGKHAKR